MGPGQKKICDALKTLDLPALREMDAYVHALLEKRVACESPHNPNPEVVETKRHSWGVEEAEAALRAAKEYADLLIHSSLDMIIAVDAGRRITEFNPAAEQAFGYRKAEVLGQPVDLLYADPAGGGRSISRPCGRMGLFSKYGTSGRRARCLTPMSRPR